MITERADVQACVVVLHFELWSLLSTVHVCADVIYSTVYQTTGLSLYLPSEKTYPSQLMCQSRSYRQSLSLSWFATDCAKETAENGEWEVGTCVATSCTSKSDQMCWYILR